MSAKPTTTHPLVASYLAELSHLLTGIDPAERAEVIEGVREHINSSLEGTAGTEHDQRAALAEVGPAQAVADEAYAGQPHAVVPTGPRTPITSRTWLPVVTAALEAVAVLLVVITTAAFSSVSSVSSTSVSAEVSADGTIVSTPTTTVTEGHFDGGFVGGAVGGFFVALPLWLIIVVLVGLSALWVSREKFALIAVVPASALAFAVLPAIGYLLLGINGVYAGAFLSLGLSVLASGVVVGALVRRGYRRASAS